MRGLQSHHRDADTVPAGNRVAVNLTGISHHDLGRGSVLVRAEQWHQSRMLDAELRVLPSLSHEVGRRGAYAVYFGSGEFPARVRVLGTNTLAPGSTGSVRIHLERPLPLVPGDRFILRESGRDETIGGGEVLDVEPTLPASRARPDRSIERLVAERGWVRADHLTRLVGHHVPATVEGWVVAPEALTSMQVQLVERIQAADALGLDLASLDDRERAAIESIDDIEISAGRATLGVPDDPLADHPWLALLVANRFTPPPPDDIDRGEVRELVRRGTVIEQDGVYFAASALEEAAGLLATKLRGSDGITVAEVRDLLGTSRKYVLPILNYFDNNGITRRRDDLRIAGPRLPEL